MDDIFDKVAALYCNEDFCIKNVSRKLNVSPQKVRKILITLGLFENSNSKAVAEYVSRNMSINDTARELDITPNCVHSYLPYTKGSYNSSEPSPNALRIRRHRLKKAEQE